MSFRLIVKAVFLIIVLVPAFFSDASGVEGRQAETGRLITEMAPPPPVTEKDKMYVETYYEPGDVLQGNRTGQWWENTTTFGYSHGKVSGYGSISQFSRLGVLDYTANIGSYVNIDKDQYVRGEIGFGWDVDYMYNLQTILEYSHRLYKNMFWQIGYSYRAYEAGDSYVLYPGLIYYFGDNYISATYGPNWIEDRDTGFSGSVKGNFFITEFLQLWSGVAFGQRLYDIYGLDAHAENGFILFGGITLKVYKGINVRVGGSYGEEEPKFIKRSLIFDASVKF